MQAWSSRPVPTLPHSSAVPPLQAFDTATQRLVSIGPDTGTAPIYVCGITPYDATHIGHANTYMRRSTSLSVCGATAESR